MTWLAYSHLGVAKTVQLTTQPAVALAGIAFGVQPVGRLVDGSGVLSRATGVTVTASKASGTGTLSGTLSVQTVEGVFTFTDLKMDTVTSAVTLSFASSGLTSATSSAFNVTQPNTIIGCEVGTYTTTGTAVTLSLGRPLFVERFEDTSIGSRDWFDGTTVPVVAGARTGGEGASVAQWSWASSATTPTNFVVARKDFTPTDSIYLSYWVQHSTNWVGSGQGDHPHLMHFLTTDDDHYGSLSQSHLTAYSELHYTTGGMIGRLLVQDNLMINSANLNVNLVGVSENRSVGGYNGQPETGFAWDVFTTAGPVYWNYKILDTPSLVITDATRNTWHRIETYFRMNTIVGGIGQPDGVIQYWVDGTLILDRHDVYFRTGASPTKQFRTFIMAPYMGSGSPLAQSMWVDDLIVATGRVQDRSTRITMAPGSYVTTGTDATLTRTAVSVWNPNEPAGMTVETDTSWDLGVPPPLYSYNADGWGYEYSGANMSIVSDPTAPRSPNNVLRISYPPTVNGGTAPCNVDNPLGAVSRTVYVSWWIKKSANWTDNGNAMTKMCFLWCTNDEECFVAQTSGGGMFFTPEPNNIDWYGPADDWGTWRHYEYLFVMNSTTAASDGIFRLWKNGTLMMSRSDIRYQSSGTPGFNRFQLSPTYGGGLNNPPNIGLYMDVDHIYISRRAT